MKKTKKNQTGNTMGDSFDIENNSSFDFKIPQKTDVPNIAQTRADGQRVLKLIQDYTEVPVANTGKFMTEDDLHSTMSEAV